MDAGLRHAFKRKQSWSEPDDPTWDGTAWHLVPSLGANEFETDLLSAVAAHSATEAFAVGCFLGNGFRPLVLHWDGTASTRVMAAAFRFEPGVDARLSDITMTKDGSAYAVGSVTWRGKRPLVLRWDGTAWSRMRVSTASEYLWLSSVAAVSPTNVIAVGGRTRGDWGMTFAVHCTP